jgi:hypothetical protein
MFPLLIPLQRPFRGNPYFGLRLWQTADYSYCDELELFEGSETVKAEASIHNMDEIQGSWTGPRFRFRPANCSCLKSGLSWLTTRVLLSRPQMGNSPLLLTSKHWSDPMVPNINVFLPLPVETLRQSRMRHRGNHRSHSP